MQSTININFILNVVHLHGFDPDCVTKYNIYIDIHIIHNVQSIASIIHDAVIINVH